MLRPVLLKPGHFDVKTVRDRHPDVKDNFSELKASITFRMLEVKYEGIRNSANFAVPVRCMTFTSVEGLEQCVALDPVE